MQSPLAWSRIVGAARIEAGQRFVPSRLSGGTTTVGAWQVVALFEASDGRSYARLANTLDPSRIKTFAQAALLDRKLFHRIA